MSDKEKKGKDYFLNVRITGPLQKKIRNRKHLINSSHLIRFFLTELYSEKRSELFENVWQAYLHSCEDPTLEEEIKLTT